MRYLWVPFFSLRHFLPYTSLPHLVHVPLQPVFFKAFQGERRLASMATCLFESQSTIMFGSTLYLNVSKNIDILLMVKGIAAKKGPSNQ